MKTKFTILLLILLTSLFGVGIFFFSNQDSYKVNDKLKIATTIFPISDITRNIVGEDIEVIQLLPSGASPHTFEPTIKDKEALKDVDIVFYIGQELDNWVLNLVDDQDVLLVDLSKKIDLIESHKDDHNDTPNTNNPHYWLSITNAKIIAEEITVNLIELDPDSGIKYIENSQDYFQELDVVKLSLEKNLKKIENRQLVTFHSAFDYFAEEFDLEIAITLEEFPGKEPTARYLKEVGDILKTEDIKVLYKEPQLSESIVSALADDYNIKVFTLDPIGGVDGRSTYIDLIKYNVSTIIEANRY